MMDPNTKLKPRVVLEAIAITRAFGDFCEPVVRRWPTPKPKDVQKQQTTVSLASHLRNLNTGMSQTEMVAYHHDEIRGWMARENAAKNPFKWGTDPLRTLAGLILKAGEPLLDNKPLGAAFWRAAEGDALADAVRKARAFRGGSRFGGYTNTSFGSLYESSLSRVKPDVDLCENGTHREFALRAFHATQRLLRESHDRHHVTDAHEYAELLLPITARALQMEPQFVFGPQQEKSDLAQQAWDLYSASMSTVYDYDPFTRTLGRVAMHAWQVASYIPDGSEQMRDFFEREWATHAKDLVLHLGIVGEEKQAVDYVHQMFMDAPTDYVRENPTPRRRTRSRR